jgi:hypothetical protein
MLAGAVGTHTVLFVNLSVAALECITFDQDIISCVCMHSSGCVRFECCCWLCCCRYAPISGGARGDALVVATPHKVFTLAGED